MYFKLFSGPNGFEFELLGGCGEFGKSLAKSQKITYKIYTGKYRLFIKMCYVCFGQARVIFVS